MCCHSRVGMPLGPDQLALSVNQAHVSEKMLIAPPACRAHGVRARPTSTMAMSSTTASSTEAMIPAQISVWRSRR